MFNELVGFSPTNTTTSTDPLDGLVGGFNFQSDPIGAVAGLVNLIPGGGLISGLVGGVASLAGLGADDWSDVEARTKKEVQTIIDYGIRTYLGSDAKANDFTKYDQYISTDARYRLDITKTQTAQNSIQKGKLQYQLLMQHLEAFRKEMSKHFVLTKETKSASALNIKSYKGGYFTHPFIEPVTYAKYEAKRNPVKPIDITSNPVDTSITNTDTSTSTDNDNNSDQDKPKGVLGWVLFGATFLAGIVYLIYKKVKS